MNWGIANSNFLFISLRQSKRTSTSTAEIHASSYFQVLCSPLLFALVTLHFSLPPSYQVLLELPVLLLKDPGLHLLEEMANRVMGNKGTVVGPRQSEGKVTVFLHLLPKQHPAALLYSYKVEVEKLELWPHPAPMTRTAECLTAPGIFLFLCSGVWNSSIRELGLEDIKHL